MPENTDKFAAKHSSPPTAAGLTASALFANDEAICTAGKKVIARQTEGLEALGESLDASFASCVRLCLRIKGAIIVAGMGKSGHVARKVASTMASTGTSAMFMHPGEASHGDLGMVGDHDMILCFSHSGETRELGDLMAYARRFRLPLAAVTFGRDSTLARMSDITLLCPLCREADNEVRAPTTSTTMFMALGDALAVCLMQARGFTTDHFLAFHPGGKLGAQLKRVGSFMHCAPDLPLCGLDTPCATAVAIISRNRYGCVGIIDAAGCLVGIITDGDLRRNLMLIGDNPPAERIMRAHPKTVFPDTLAAEALAYLSEQKILSLFVVQENRPVGIIHVHDFLTFGVI